MIDSERALQDVAVPVSRASGVGSVAATPPTRNTSRDVQRKKAVSEQINLHGMVDISGDSAIVKGKFFSRFNIAKGHDNRKYAMCQTCIEEGSLHLTRVSRGAAVKDTSSTLNMRHHLFIHHAKQFDELLVLEGKRLTVQTGEGMRGHFLPKVPKHGAPLQYERETLDSLLMLVTNEMDPWQRVESHAVQKTMRAVNLKAWTPCVDTVQQHARVVKAECKAKVHTWLEGGKVSGDWFAAASSASLASSPPLNKSSSDIADEEITLWRMRLQELLSHKNPLTELRRASSVVPWITHLGKKVLAVPATSAAPERMLSSAGNIMTKKRARLSCDHLEELMYLHEVWPKVREWTAMKKARLA